MFRIFSGHLTRPRQQELVEIIRGILEQAPLYSPTMPRTGQPFSVRMSNCGPLGWVSDRQGYRYQPHHPRTHRPWPEIPETLRELWHETGGCTAPPEACLINWYEPQARMGLHQDDTEADLSAPIVSISLGDDCRFRMGGLKRSDPTRSVRLHSGDVVVFGGESRLAFHGVDRIYAGTGTLLEKPGRINLTLRRVTVPQR